MAEQLNGYGKTRRLVVSEIERALAAVDPAEVEGLIQAILGAEKVFVIGVGRVMISLQAFAKRLNHLGIETYCVGDINEPAITDRDLLLVGPNYPINYEDNEGNDDNCYDNNQPRSQWNSLLTIEPICLPPLLLLGYM